MKTDGKSNVPYYLSRPANEIQAQAMLVLDKVLLGMAVTADDAYALAELQQAYSLDCIAANKRKFSSDRLKYLRTYIAPHYPNISQIDFSFSGD